MKGIKNCVKFNFNEGKHIAESFGYNIGNIHDAFPHIFIASNNSSHLALLATAREYYLRFERNGDLLSSKQSWNYKINE